MAAVSLLGRCRRRCNSAPATRSFENDAVSPIAVDPVVLQLGISTVIYHDTSETAAGDTAVLEQQTAGAD
jgi:hypothetical protein